MGRERPWAVEKKKKERLQREKRRKGKKKYFKMGIYHCFKNDDPKLLI